ncbi:FAD-binding domain-containing protein [Novosphingobium olei]|uniref:Deoxyribodipyrimidine photolyase n=1 Tax=Novosphingobium olei TaxID=2728851 RepID=A0A7Y0G8N8_9SPHN|nr:FAD-binding domain-containing protein [Novosphingobium olei]NML92258.1 deoxyribodipyrimidine photolyase [Novosphingobium olei]
MASIAPRPAAQAQGFAEHPVTREAALLRLDAFLPQAGLVYAARRNEEHGAGRHHAVSRLSAALRRRLVSEAEVVARVRAAHGESADKFVTEVFWRSYFKGWLEARPQVWASWRGDLHRLDLRLGEDDGFAARHLAACRGETGIDCFDHWVEELEATGYLHNWARMQFASIWVFTLGLPWQLGARFFLDRLIDGDAASNTLSWRWVAGLHTRGKAYLADADRIARMTGGRFSPRGLATVARIPDEPPAPAAALPRAPLRWQAGVATVLWLTTEDLSLELEAALGDLDVRGVAVLASDGAVPADKTALGDGVQRAVARWHCPFRVCSSAEELAAFAHGEGAGQVLTGFATVGPALEAFPEMKRALRHAGLTLGEHRRAWDDRAWPHATKGFFALKEKIPQLIAAAGIR